MYLDKYENDKVDETSLMQDINGLNLIKAE